MVQRLTSGEASIAQVLADPESAVGRDLLEARDALLRAMGPVTDEFSDPDFIQTTILPLLYDKYVAWLAFNDSAGDGVTSISRFAVSVSNYARRMTRQGLFKRVQPSRYYVTHTYDQFISCGSRYSSVPPSADAAGEKVVAEPPLGLDGDVLMGLMSDQVIEVAQDLMVSFVRLAGSEIGCPASKEYAAELSGALGALKSSGPRALGPFLQLLLQDDTKIHIRNFMYRFEEWFFGAFIDALREWQTRGSEMLDDGRLEELSGISDGIIAQFDRGYDYLRMMREVREGIGTLLTMDVGRPYKAGWAGYMMRARTLHHDYANPLMALQGVGYEIKGMSKGQGKERSTNVLERLMRPFDASSISSLVEMIMGMAREDADRAGIALKSGRLDSIRIPRQHRSSLFRILHELVRNSIKYHDAEKDTRFVKIETKRGKGGEMAILITDNGVGIADVEEALKWGARERPDLAVGSGVGLANVERLAKENGWRFEIQSQLGACTRAKLFMNVGGWGRGDPEEPEDSLDGSTPPDQGFVATQGSMEAAGFWNVGVNTTPVVAGVGLMALCALH